MNNHAGITAIPCKAKTNRPNPEAIVNRETASTRFRERLKLNFERNYQVTMRPKVLPTAGDSATNKACPISVNSKSADECGRPKLKVDFN